MGDPEATLLPRLTHIFSLFSLKGGNYVTTLLGVLGHVWSEGNRQLHSDSGLVRSQVEPSFDLLSLT